MAEPLSIAASIAGLVSLADVVVCRMVKYVRTTINAKEHISALLAETLNLHGVLRSLELLTRQYEDEAAVYTQAHHLFSCYLSLTRLRELLEKADPVKRSSSLKAFKDILHWPLSKPDTDRFVDELERHKSTLTLALSADSLANILKALSRQQEIGEDVKEIKHEIRKQQKRIDVYMDAKEQEKLMAFLGTVDPTRNQKIGLDLLQPGTGLWFTEGEELKWWLATENAKLWVYGIPGAGKTVLMALIIKTIQDTVPQEAGMAYFYCDYKSIETQRPLNIMGALVKQLALQDSHAFEKLRGFYEDHQQGRNVPGLLSAESLRDLLVEMSQCFDDTLIVIDGLDECNSKDRGLVMELLSSLNASCSNSIKTLFASRDESDIRSALENYKVISIAAQSSDLRIYVAAEIQSRIDKNLLRLRSTSIKEHVMNRLVEKADGMFRWVTCQIDYICQLPNDRERSKALESLPPTLAATYDRILDRVNKSNAINQNMVQRTLRWVRCGYRLSLAELAEAISVEPGDQHMDQDTVFDENSILSWCSSLIRVSRGFGSNTDIVEFAHFTVKEYLNDIDPKSGSPFGPYSIRDKDTIEMELAQTCLTYLRFDNFANDYPKNYEEYKSLIDLRPFSTYTAQLWQDHCIRDTEIPDLGNEEILNLSCHLFRPSKSNNFMTLLQICYYGSLEERYEPCEIGLRDGIAPWAVDCSTLHWACLSSYPELCRYLVNQGADVNKASSLGSPLCCAVMDFDAAFEFEFELQQHVRLKGSIPRAALPSPFKDNEHHIDNTIKILDILFEAGAALDCTSQIVRQPDARPLFSAFGLALYNEPVPGRWTGKFLERGIICDRQDLEIIFGSPRYLQLPTLRRLIDLIGNKNIKAEDRGWFAEMVLSRTSVCPKSLPINLPSEGTLQEQQHLLTSAARAGQDEIVEKLLTQHHVSPNTDDGDESPLHWAVLNNFPGVVETLISFGANVYQLRAIAGTMATPLHLATKHQDVKILNRLLAVAERVENDSSGLSVMHTAARNGNFAAVQLLHQHCQDHCIQLTHRTSDGRTPLLCAAESGSVEIMQFLIDTTDASILSDRSTDDSTATHFAAQSESPTAALKFLIEHDPTQVNQLNAADYSPLHYVLEQRQTDATCSAAKMLLEKGADIALKDKRGTSCLSKVFKLWATEVANPSVSASPSTSLLELFLDQPQCREAVNIQVTGKQPLTLAVQKQNEALVQKLLNLRCSVDERDEDDEGYTSLEQACVAGCSSGLFEQLLHQSKMNANQQRATCGCNLLHLAASKGHVNLVKVLLGNKLDVDDRTTCFGRHGSERRYSNMTALMLAACDDRLPVTKMLVQEGADCNATDGCGFTALHYASERGSLEAVKLLESERLVSQDTARYNHVYGDLGCLTPCHVAVLYRHYHLVNYFFATYAFINGNYTTRSGITLLHVAAYNGDSPLLELLVSKNSQVNAAEKKDQWTALHYASAKGHSDAVQTLLDCGADPGQKTLGGMTAELLAIGEGHLQIAKTLHEICSKLVLPKGGNVSLSGEKHFNERSMSLSLTQALFDAIWKGDFQFCERLLDEGAEVNGTNLRHEGATPLMCSLVWGQLKIARLLLQRGANSRGRLLAGPCKGWTSIHFAASCQDAGILTALLEQGPSDANADPVTPLHIAAAYGHLACAKTILDHDASSTKQEIASNKNHKGQQPLWLEVTQGSESVSVPGCVKGPPTSTQISRSVRLIPGLIDSVIDPESCNWTWQLTPSMNTESAFTDGTALHIAVGYEHAGVVDLLLSRGADIEATSSKYKQTPLHHAARIGSVPVVKILIRANANVNCRDINGKTSFMVASKNGHTHVLDELFANGADVFARDIRGQHALHWGINSNDLNVISHLMAYGLKFNSPDFYGCYPLYYALCSQDKIVESFACDFTAVNCFLDFNISEPYLLLAAVIRNRPLSLRRILEKIKAKENYNLNNKASGRWPPALHAASLKGCLECMVLLLEAGADIGGIYEDYGTPLGAACAMGRLEAVQYLIGQGAKTSWLGSDGKVTGAIQKASQHKRVVEWLERSVGGDSTVEADVSPPESGASIIQKQRIRNQRHREVSDAIQGHNYSDSSRIRRRSSFIYEYVVPHSFPSSEFTEFKAQIPLEKTLRAQLEFDQPFREKNFQVYENAIYRKRSLLPEERYFLYPLAPLTMRDSSTGPWVMF